ncbi:kinetoplast-associated protein-like protein [Strigomonas culicis]|uniref:Kinetoplast-associated protein-like protein n=1 Tax=Strigomonas culicis TaxID=28005 RepID=S9UBP9_9TRYP|nr:kinetoplast-associated protein-like protein [Strigomonas culicis]|eukprot:EPY26134.1 kinetoplast-associated protein-like protein [Strigomonas culicis]
MPPKKKTPGPSAQTGVSARARADPSRKIGNANAVAAGVDLSRVGVISDRELAWIQRLATEGEGGTFADYRAAQERQRKEISSTRKAGWPDTTEARHEHFLQRQAEEKEEAERRKRALDELYHQEDEEARRQVNARAELQHMVDDPRGQCVKSARLLDETLKGREQQVAENERQRAADGVDRARELAEIQARDWGQAAEDARLQLELRQRNVDTKLANLELLAEQIDERRQGRAAYRGGRAQVDAEAAEEAAENFAEADARRRRELANGVVNKANSRKAVNKADKLQRRIQEDAVADEERVREEARVDALKQSTLQKQQQKQGAFAARQQLGLEHYQETATKPGATYRTQDVFEEKGESFLDKMYKGDAKRVETQRETLRHADFGDTELQGDRPSTWRAATHHGAQARTSGFLSKEEEEAHVLETRALPAKVRAEAEAEAAARLAAAQQLKAEQRAQADERREQNLRAKQAQQDEELREEAAMKADNERYQQFIEGQLPKDMNPVLRKRVQQLR